MTTKHFIAAGTVVVACLFGCGEKKDHSFKDISEARTEVQDHGISVSMVDSLKIEINKTISIMKTLHRERDSLSLATQAYEIFVRECGCKFTGKQSLNEFISEQLQKTKQ